MTRFNPLFRTICILAVLAATASCSFAVESEDDLPERLNGVGVDEMLNGEIPLDVSFMGHDGSNLTFGDLLKDGRPILLTLNYSDCPGLCVSQLNGLTRGINELGSLSLGKDFKMVSLSINPRESLERSLSTKNRYADVLADHHQKSGWTFLTGTESNILQIARSVGFRYTYDSKNDRYNHGAAAIFISPKGRVTRYLYEIGFTPETLKMAFVEAGEGRIGSSLDSIVLWCYHYDANENRYSANAKTILAFTAGIFSMVGVAASLPFWLSRKKRSETLSHVPIA